MRDYGAVGHRVANDAPAVDHAVVAANAFGLGIVDFRGLVPRRLVILRRYRDGGAGGADTAGLGAMYPVAVL